MHPARSLLLAIPLLVAVAGCSDSGGDPTIDEGAVTTLPSSTSSSSTTIPLPIPVASAEEAVTALLDAWQAGDRGAALQVAEVQAVDALFAVEPEPTQARGCNSADVNPTITCVYRLAAGELQVRAVPVDAGGYIVDFVILGGV